ncbi:transposase, partial [Acidovorax sp.]|uniref:transposase n=1 Tax=Acidovorax sp. TaxID=1872122 RepID=UPI0027B8D3D9
MRVGFPRSRRHLVRMVQEQRGEYPSLWAAIESIAPKIGCMPQTLNEWVKRAEVDAGTREGVTTAEAQRVKELEREVKELRR